MFYRVSFRVADREVGSKQFEARDDDAAMALVGPVDVDVLDRVPTLFLVRIDVGVRGQRMTAVATWERVGGWRRLGARTRRPASN